MKKIIFSLAIVSMLVSGVAFASEEEDIIPVYGAVPPIFNVPDSERCYDSTGYPHYKTEAICQNQNSVLGANPSREEIQKELIRVMGQLIILMQKQLALIS